MKIKKILLIALLCLPILGCDKTDVVKYKIKAIVWYAVPPDNCNDYVIVVNADQLYAKYYKPNNLPDKFKVDNLSVEVTYTVTEETHNCGFGGYIPIIHILKIKEL